MTTITFEQGLSLRRTKFKDIFDFQNYLRKFLAMPAFVLGQISDEDITDEIDAKLKKAKALPDSQFVNL